MRLAIVVTYFILPLLNVAVYGCPPPFNDFQYAKNDTLLREKIDQYRSDPQLGWAHIIGGTSPVTTWPANDKGIVIIPYCWADAWSKRKFVGKIEEAWRRWSNKLREPGAQSGHRLGGMKEVTDEHGGTLFCYWDKQHKLWKKRVPADTVVIRIGSDTFVSYGTWAYAPKEWKDEKGRHQLQIGWHNNPVVEGDHYVTTLAHEMGHMLGLTHEHQRRDRDSYVKFDYSKLMGYEEAILPSKEHSFSIEQMCTSSVTTQAYYFQEKGFCASEFSKEPWWDRLHPFGYQHDYQVTAGREYDYESIMHYGSDTFSSNVWSTNPEPMSIHNVPMVRWKQGRPGYQPPEKVTEENAELMPRLSDQKRPSDGDAQGVRRLYPWQG